MQATYASRMRFRTSNKAKPAWPARPRSLTTCSPRPSTTPHPHPRSTPIMHYKTDQQQEQQQQQDPAAISAGAPTADAGSVLAKAVECQQVSVQLSADDVMSDMCTMLGGIRKECFTGYAGQWRTWEILPTHQLQQQQQQQQHDNAPAGQHDPNAAPSITSITTASITKIASSSNSSSSKAESTDGDSSPTAKCSTSQGQHSIRLIDDSVNVRLWRVQGGFIGLQKAEAAAVGSEETIQQANFYHHPVKMAGPSTRFAQYLTGNTMSGRPDGYGLRVWSFTRDSDMLKPDASSWLDGSGTPSECSMRVLTVPDRGTTIINGSLPSGFGEGHNPRFWVLEFIAKDPASSARRWASMNWYDLGELVVNRSINEDLLQLSGEPDEITIDPQHIHFSERREGLLPLDVDGWALQHTQTQQGTATVFSFASVPGDQGAQELHLVRTADLPCTWTNPWAASAAAASAAAGAVSAGSSKGASQSDGQQQQQQEQKQEAEGGVDVVVQVYPDWSYCRVPRSIRETVGSGRDSAVFEAGTVLSDGSLVRWLLEYETAGRRLIKSARFETYPAAQPLA